MHSVFCWFFEFLDGTSWEDPMSVKGLILMHLGCGGHFTEFWCAFSLFTVFRFSWWNCSRRPHVCEWTDFDASGLWWLCYRVLMCIQSFYGFLGIWISTPFFFLQCTFLQWNCSRRTHVCEGLLSQSSSLAYVLSWSFCHVGCGVCFLWGMFEAKVSHIEGLWQFWKL